MQTHAYVRYNLTAGMYLVLEDPVAEGGVETYVKDVKISFTNDPSAPRQVVVCEEPLPSGAVLTAIVDRYGVQSVPGGEWTVTSIEPVLNSFGVREMYRHQVAMRNKPNFGYEGMMNS